MLLDEFDSNTFFFGGAIRAAFKERLSLQFAADHGSQPLEGDHMIGGGWRLTPRHDLSVSDTVLCSSML